jgi:hypothetical protein
MRFSVLRSEGRRQRRLSRRVDAAAASLHVAGRCTIHVFDEHRVHPS